MDEPGPLSLGKLRREDSYRLVHGIGAHPLKRLRFKRFNVMKQVEDLCLDLGSVDERFSLFPRRREGTQYLVRQRGCFQFG